MNEKQLKEVLKKIDEQVIQDIETYERIRIFFFVLQWVLCLLVISSISIFFMRSFQ